MNRNRQFDGLDEMAIAAIARDPREPAERRRSARRTMRDIRAQKLSAARAAVMQGSRAVEIATARLEALREGTKPIAAAAPRKVEVLDPEDDPSRFEHPPKRDAAEIAAKTIVAKPIDVEARVLDENVAPAAPKPGTASRSTKFKALAEEYEAMFAAARLASDWIGRVDRVCDIVVRNGETYRGLSRSLGVPWTVIGLIHGLEASFDFTRHLHNGDPLTARTRRVPAGRPLTGAPPYSWTESADDALRSHRLHLIEDWSLARSLYELERYNGFGYRYRGLATPYLWSGTDRYVSGKFVRDGIFEPAAISRQVGAAAALLRLAERGDL